MQSMDRTNIIPVNNETKSSISRMTAEGKQIRYCMTVLQQPLRARACGAGAKSSADRRPVDPPPIVELKIFEGEGTDNDITFNMNANYFLFATLEQARPMANGRMPEDKTNRLTVLTGTPVAGMVYLDRPSPAGYFIFPDLSVRHEGKYRLSFSLYEELKNAKDDDKNLDASRSAAGDAHVTHRLEVKSEPFVVFSAKKFPGLTESTSLSRMVAEQGCRVRIRRDVRMRRRDNKLDKEEWDEYEGNTASVRARVSGTPEAYGHGYIDSNGRPRSASNASHQSINNPLSRRPSLQELGQGYQTFGTAPHTPQGGYVQSSPYGPSPNQQFSQPPYMQQQQPPMQPPPPPPQYQQQPYPHPQSVAPQQSYYNYAPQPQQPSAPQQQYPPPPHAFESAPPHRVSVDFTSSTAPDHRRTSSQFSIPPQPQASYAPQPPAPQGYPPHTAPQQSYPQPPALAQQPMYVSQPPPSRNFTAQSGYQPRPAPLEPVQPPPRAMEPRSAYDRMAPPSLPPLQIPSELAQKLEPSSPAALSSSAPQSSYYNTSAAASTESHKRSFGNVFNDRHLSQPLRQGARPITPYGQMSSYSSVSGSYDVDCDPDTMQGLQPMAYRRANGAAAIRNLPPNSIETGNA